MQTAKELKSAIDQTERELLKSLRDLRREQRARQKEDLDCNLTRGQRIADAIASAMGSWHFIIIQSIVLFFWIAINISAYVNKWDPYPFILLNLALSFQAAYAAPFIMMSQNRQQDIDRKAALNDYEVNIKAELEIELLHHKMDQLREMEILNLTQSIADLTDILSKAGIEVKKK